MSKKVKNTDAVALYPITLEPHEEGGYFASCSTFQGCHADGETMGEAIDNIRDIIRVHIEARRKFGEPIPSVSFPRYKDLKFTLPMPVG